MNDEEDNEPITKAVENGLFVDATCVPTPHAGIDEPRRVSLNTIDGAVLGAGDSFMRMLSHELRNTLSPITLLAEQFRGVSQEAQPPHVLSARAIRASRSLQNVVSTIGRIVDLIDLRRGKLDLEPTNTDLVEVVHDVQREMLLHATAGGIETVLLVDTP